MREGSNTEMRAACRIHVSPRCEFVEDSVALFSTQTTVRIHTTLFVNNIWKPAEKANTPKHTRTYLGFSQGLIPNLDA